MKWTHGAGRELALEAEIRQLREQLARIEEQFRIAQTQLIHSQRLAQVGSWERDLATGKVLWSDEMYRICVGQLAIQVFKIYNSEIEEDFR